MSAEVRRLVLKREFSRSDFRLVAWERDWDAVDLGREEAGSYVDIWQSYDHQAEIHYIDDRPIGMHYVTLQGEGSDAVELEIRQDCELVTLPEALESLRTETSRSEKLVSIYAVALTADPEQDEDVVEALRSVARDPDPGIRQAVVVATGYLPWPELVELVDEIGRTDPVEHVRNNARILLEGLRYEGDS